MIFKDVVLIRNAKEMITSVDLTQILQKRIILGFFSDDHSLGEPITSDIISFRIHNPRLKGNDIVGDIEAGDLSLGSSIFEAMLMEQMDVSYQLVKHGLGNVWLCYVTVESEII